jgi:PAS domain S-box-containing protein
LKKRSDDPGGPSLRERLLGLGERSHRKSYYPALRERLVELERFHKLLDESEDGILLLELPEGTITDINEAGRRFLGGEPRLGTRLEDLVQPSAQAQVVNRLRDVQHGPSRPFTMRVSSVEGTRHLELSISSHGSFEGRSFAVLVIRDQTERMRAEEERDVLRVALYQAAKMEAVGQLAGGIAHDFNNLLTVILSGAEALRRDLAEGLPPESEVIEEVRAAGERARDLTRQLLAFARRQVIRPVPTDLNALVRGSEKLLRRVLGEDVEIQVQLHPALWPVRCDAGQIEQLVLNLAVNARDAMPRGGTLTLSTANAQVDERLTAARPWMRAGEYARMSIRDSGQGMSPEVKAHVFEPFFTTKPAGKGTGLGLATVYGIVKQNDGYILVESEPGVGTTFDVYLPRIMDAPARGASPGAAASAPGGSETILVVEDDPQVREVTVRSLRSGGYRVLVARDASGALEIAGREGDGLHLLVTDVVMPGLDGRAVADELRRHHPRLRVLYVSGHAEEVIVKRGVLEPGIELLPKPFTPSSLLRRVRAILDAKD